MQMIARGRREGSNAQVISQHEPALIEPHTPTDGVVCREQVQLTNVETGAAVHEGRMI